MKPLRFPPAWAWFVDEAIPGWVKTAYSPRESWKGKPFSEEDARFFFKGIDELSELFTDERPKSIPAYFQHPKFRSAYLLYFVPLQAAKFVSLFQEHPKAVDEALAHARESGSFRVLDLGAGPGTASLALLLVLLERAALTGEELPPIELHWFDTQAGVMRDGQSLVELLSGQFSRLRGRVTVTRHELPWWEAVRRTKGDFSLILMGHVVNEGTGSRGPRPRAEAPEDEGSEIDSALREQVRPWTELLSRAKGGGYLMVEPAAKKPSQFLSQLRDGLFETEALERSPASLWGPCLHAERCPLADGRDWCHFSVPVEIPGRWFREFSRGLGSERQWLKFSYLWVASAESPAPQPEPRLRRVVSDPLGGWVRESTHSEVLICEPETPGKLRVTGKPPQRGDLIRLPGEERRAREKRKR